MSGLILGVDPGLGGSAAFYDPATHEIRQMVDTPTFSNDKNAKRTINIPELVNLIAPLMELTTLAVIEEPGAMPSQGLSSTFAFGKACGIITGIVASHRVQIIHANPAAWKLAMGLSRDKEQSRKRATDLFPKQSHFFTRKGDDGRAEAILLAVFGWRCVQSSKNRNQE